MAWVIVRSVKGLLTDAWKSQSVGYPAGLEMVVVLRSGLLFWC